MGILLGMKKHCRSLRDALEESPDRSGLSPELREHLARCPGCQALVDELESTRALLQVLPPQRYAPSPWFAQHVMVAISARESLLRSLDTWTLVPRLAAKLTWVSAFALLIAATWLYESPSYTTPSQSSSTESLFDGSSPAPPVQDDLLSSLSGVAHD